MVPVTDINSYILFGKTTKIGFEVSTTMTNGRTSNTNLVNEKISREVKKLYAEFNNSGLPVSLIHLIYQTPYFYKNFYNN